MYNSHEYQFFHFSNRRQYPPISLLKIQLLIDNGAINPEEPIDLASLCNSHFFKMDPKLNHYGVNLVDEGMDSFKSKINIEVQHANEPVIAAIERNGGTITTAYFDMKSVIALHNPLKFFESGKYLVFIWFLKLFFAFLFRPTHTEKRTSNRRCVWVLQQPQEPRIPCWSSRSRDGTQITSSKVWLWVARQERTTDDNSKRPKAIILRTRTWMASQSARQRNFQTNLA